MPDTSELNPNRRLRRWWWVLVLILVAAVGIWIARRGGVPASANSRGSNAPNAGPAAPGGSSGQAGRSGRGGPQVTPVAAAKSYRGNIPVYQTGLGSVAAFYTVTVKSRVDGQLMNLAVREGDFVREGQLLAQIDPRPFEVQLAQAQGQMARDQATLANARLDLSRYQTLIQQEARVAVMTMTATRQPRRTERARSAGSASAFRHSDTWTRKKAVASGTRNIANE